MKQAPFLTPFDMRRSSSTRCVESVAGMVLVFDVTDSNIHVGRYLKLGHDLFLSHACQFTFINHYVSFVIRIPNNKKLHTKINKFNTILSSCSVYKLSLHTTDSAATTYAVCVMLFREIIAAALKIMGETHTHTHTHTHKHTHIYIYIYIYIYI